MNTLKVFRFKCSNSSATLEFWKFSTVKKYFWTFFSFFDVLTDVQHKTVNANITRRCLYEYLVHFDLWGRCFIFIKRLCCGYANRILVLLFKIPQRNFKQINIIKKIIFSITSIFKFIGDTRITLKLTFCLCNLAPPTTPLLCLNLWSHTETLLILSCRITLTKVNENKEKQKQKTKKNKKTD